MIKNSDNESEKLIDFIIVKKYYNFFNSKLFISSNNLYNENSTLSNSSQYERIFSLKLLFFSYK